MVFGTMGGIVLVTRPNNTGHNNKMTESVTQIITHADRLFRSAWVERSVLSVCLSAAQK